MLTKDIVEGERYIAKISGRLTIVKVAETKKYTYSRSRTRFECVNEQTGRTITATAAKLRRRAREDEKVTKVVKKEKCPDCGTSYCNQYREDTWCSEVWYEINKHAV